MQKTTWPLLEERYQLEGLALWLNKNAHKSNQASGTFNDPMQVQLNARLKDWLTAYSHFLQSSDPQEAKPVLLRPHQDPIYQWLAKFKIHPLFSQYVYLCTPLPWQLEALEKTFLELNANPAKYVKEDSFFLELNANPAKYVEEDRQEAIQQLRSYLKIIGSQTSEQMQTNCDPSIDFSELDPQKLRQRALTLAFSQRQL